ncbi:unnamed protein product, partial [Rotaria magnacalcarata]
VCSKAADVLSQKQHEDIESDYERGKENNSTSVISLNVSDKRKRTTKLTNEDLRRDKDHSACPRNALLR